MGGSSRVGPRGRFYTRLEWAVVEPVGPADRGRGTERRMTWFFEWSIIVRDSFGHFRTL